MPNLIRQSLQGVSLDPDTLWTIEVADETFGLTGYNDEITGFSPELQELPGVGKHVHYGGNAYYVLNELRRRGFIVTVVDDR